MFGVGQKEEPSCVLRLARMRHIIDRERTLVPTGIRPHPWYIFYTNI
jgi:hypothetical protein